MPSRIQRSRCRGWRMPEGAVYVGRPSKWGNPFPVDGACIMWATVARGRRNSAETRHQTAIELYRGWLLDQPLPPAAAADKSDLIVYESGIALSTAEAARGIAATCAWINREEVKIRRPPTLDEIRQELRGKDLVCWCPLHLCCHAEILLELANG